MSYLDFILAGVIFTIVIVTMFALIPGIIKTPETSKEEFSLSELKEIVEHQFISVAGDCNTIIFNCNYWNSIILNVEKDKNIIASIPFYKNKNKIYSISRIGHNDLFYFNHDIERMHYDSDLNYSINPFRIKNNLVDLNVFDFNAVIDFNNLIDLNLFYPIQSFAVDLNDSVIASTSSNDINFISLMQTPETIIELKKNIDLNLQLNQLQLQVNDNNLINGFNEWWDSNSNDELEWNYRIGLSFNSKNNSGSDLNAVIDLNFNKILKELNIINYPDQNDLDYNSIRVVEYSFDGNFIDWVSETDYNESLDANFNYNKVTKMGSLKFRIPNELKTREKRLFFLYFDLNSVASLKEQNYKSIENAVNDFYFFKSDAEKKSNYSTKKYFNTSSIIFGNENSVKIELSNDCNVIKKELIEMICDKNSLIKLRFRTKLPEEEFLKKLKLIEGPLIKRNLITEKKFNDFNAVNSRTKEYYVKFISNDINLFSGSDLNTGEFKEFIESFVSNEGIISNGLLKIKKQK